MANFLQLFETMTVGTKKTITMIGGGPPPKKDRLRLEAASKNIVDIAFKQKQPRDGPYYDWEITAKAPGITEINAFIKDQRPSIKYAPALTLTVNGLINIEFSPNGEGKLECVGLGKKFKVLGDPKREYPKDIIVDPQKDPSVKEDVHQSKEFNVPMPWAIRIWGQLGIYIHEMPDNLRENDGPSAGCIHVGKGNAKQVYDYVKTRTRILIKYPW